MTIKNLSHAKINSASPLSASPLYLVIDKING